MKQSIRLAIQGIAISIQLGMTAMTIAALVVSPRGGGALTAVAGLLALAVISGAMAAWGAWTGDEPPSELTIVRLLIGSSISFGLAALAVALVGLHPERELSRMGASLLVTFGFAIPIYVGVTALTRLAQLKGEAEEVSEGQFMLLTSVGAAIGVLLAALVVAPRFNPAMVLVWASAIGMMILLFTRAWIFARPMVIVLDERETPWGSIRVEDEQTDHGTIRRLVLNDEDQSCEGPIGESQLAYARAAVALFSRPIDSALFLGGGAYTLPRALRHAHLGARIVVVERDPEVTEIAERWFDLDDEAMVIEHADARAFVDCVDESFDLIYVDVHAGAQALLPGLTTLEAMENLAGMRNKGGLVVFNAISETSSEAAVRIASLLRTAQERFPSVSAYLHHTVDYDGLQNVMVVAGDVQPIAESIGGFGLWPNKEWMSLEAAVYRDLDSDDEEVEP